MVADTHIYFGRLGNLASIPHPKGIFDATRTRMYDVFELGAGGVRVDQMTGGARTYVIPYEGLTGAAFATLQAYADGLEGPGPFALLDPGQRNMLPSNIAGATSVTNSIDGINGGTFALAGLSDNFNRAAVASGWGTTTSGWPWTTTGGIAANYSTSGTVGTMSLTTLTTARRARLAGAALADFDITADVTISAALTGAGGQSENGIRARYIDDNNFVDIRAYRNVTGDSVTVAVRQLLAGVETVSSFVAVTGATTASVVTLRLRGSGSALQGWGTVTGQTPSTSPQVSLSGVTMLTPGAVEVYTLLTSSITNALPMTVTWDNIAVTDPGTPLASSTAYTDAGPRVLAWSDHFTTLTIDWPSTTFAYGVPVVSGRAVCFSCYVRGGGADPVVTYTPRLIWRDATGAVVSTTSGTPVASASGAWAQMFVTGTPPATAVYADMDIQYTSGAGAGSIGYFRRFMFNEGATPDTSWRPGTGVWPVKVVGLDESWLGLFSDFRSGPGFVVREDTS